MTRSPRKPGPDSPQPKRAPRPPRPMTQKRLDNIAIYYLQRYSTTAAHLQRVLSRRVEKALRAHGEKPGATRADMKGWIEAVVARQVASGAVNDTAYAEGRTAALRRLGKGPGKIRALLAAKGIAAAVVVQVLADTETTATGEDAALQAAIAYVRRRRLGPYRTGPRDKDTDRKDLGALARAGFSFAIAKAALNASDDD
jgi:regulatory protein